MSYIRKLGLLAAAFLLDFISPVYAQDPLSVEVSAGAHHGWDRITVRIKNISKQEVMLIIPANIPAKGEWTIFQVPLDVERLEGEDWILCHPSSSRRPFGSSPIDIQSGQTRVFTFGVVTTGEYRVRAWYIANPGDLGPPKRLPVFASVLSEPFEVVQQDLIPASAQTELSVLALRPLRLCGTMISFK